MSKIPNDDLTRSDTECFIVEPIIMSTALCIVSFVLDRIRIMLAVVSSIALLQCGVIGLMLVWIVQARMMFDQSSVMVLIVFWTWSALQTLAASTTTSTFSCEPAFNDAASRTMLSSVVFQGRVTRTRTGVSQHESRLTSSTSLDVVELRVTRVLKGAVASEMVTVVANCSLNVEVGVMYVVFVVDASTSLTSEVTKSLHTPVLYGVVGRLEPSTRRIIRQVTEFACPDCEGQ